MKAKLLTELRKVHRVMKSGKSYKYVFTGKYFKTKKKYASRKYYSSGWSKRDDKILNIYRTNLLEHAREVFESSQNTSIISIIRNLYYGN
jgi:hypothetical protein